MTVILPRDYVPYPVAGPRMDKSVPPSKLQPGNFGHLAGVDGRFSGCLRKFYGMSEVVDLDSISTGIDVYSGPSFFKYVSFKQKGTSLIYRGFVVRWDSLGSLTNQRVDLFYTLDNGTTWAAHEVWDVGNSITNVLEMDCSSYEDYLFVCVKGKSPKTVYYDSTLLTVDMGPGVFSATLAALALSGSPVKADNYYLAGDGVFQVAWRFYDSKRGIYSALSDPVTIQLGVFKQSASTGSITFSAAGTHSGKMTSGDIIAINGRTYKYITSGGDVTIPVASYDDTAGHCTALTDAINGDTSAYATATAGETSVTLTSKIRGADGNSYALTITEVGAVNDMSVSGTTMTGGGASTTDPETGCKATLAFPNNTVVLAGGTTYAAFDALFDTVDIFRTINLGTSTGQQGAIFYLEQSIAEADNWTDSGTWDALTVDIGTILDEALPFQTMYDPEKDTVASPPQSGTIERYQNVTFMADGFDTKFSSMEHQSAEYFSTYNVRQGSITEGEPLRYLLAGDSLFILSPSAIIHVYISMYGKPLQYTKLHLQRGLVSKGAAHSVGNSIVMLSGIGLVILNASDGSMGQITALDRLLSLEWIDELDEIESGYDALLNASFFLNPTKKEVAIVWHTTQVCTLLEGANFVSATAGLDIETAKKVRTYFITETGLVVTPDVGRTGSGTMWGLSASYTLNGTTTTASAGTSLTDTEATFDADMIGSLCYMASGDNAGEYQEITAVTGTTILTFTPGFSHQTVAGDRYAISPVPFKIQLWPLQDQQTSSFQRWIMTGMAISVGGLSGFTNNPNAYWRVGAYRNGSSTLETTTEEITVSSNPADSVGSINIDGIIINPYIEQISSGTNLELIGIEVLTPLSESRRVTA